jgi:hypothetical protein
MDVEWTHSLTRETNMKVSSKDLSSGAGCIRTDIH